MIRRNYKRVTRMLRSLIHRRKNINYFSDYFDNDPGVSEVNKFGREMLVIRLRHYNHPVFARDYPHSDINVLKQVLLEDEYKPVVDFISSKFGINDKLNVIDAGANVGYFSFYVKEKIPGASIACIEPDESNMKVLEINLKNFIETGEIVIYRNGLGPVSNLSLKINYDFRGGNDWSLTVSETARSTGLKSITIRDIMNNNKWEHIDLLKVDIEGGERFLFAKDADISYLDKVKVMALEIHDEFGVRDSIYEILRARNFLIRELGETTMLINNKYF